MTEPAEAVCFDCKTPLENVHETQWKETQAVREMKVTEDDGYWVYHDKTYTVKGMVGYCPKCHKQKTQDWYSGLWW